MKNVGKFCNLLRDERGNVVLITGFVLTALVGVAGLGLSMKGA
jgi:hypothetical protein